MRDSLDRMYEIQKPECTMVFTEPVPAHDDVIKRILYHHHHSQSSHANTQGDDEIDSDLERSKFDAMTMREEPDDDRAEEDNARIDDILNNPDDI